MDLHHDIFIDLTQWGPMSTGHSRLQSLFQNFYGVGLQENGAKGITDRFNPDGPLYSPDAHFRREVINDNLVSLKKCLSDTDSQIRNLDVKLQNLVYQNYSKFIDAEDSFQKMDDNIAGMEKHIDTLNNKVETIDAATGQVDVNLGDRRERLENISAVNRLLIKV